MVPSPALPELEPGSKPILALVDLVHDLFRHTLLRVQPALAEEGVTMGQFWALRTISELEAASLGKVARYLGVSPPTVCANIDMLEAAGLVRRARSEKDRRTVELSLTPRGRRVETRIWREISRLMSDAAVKIPERDLLAAVRVIRAITEGLQPTPVPLGRAP
jgi:MarR family transcriptional regulator, organic hydroperoxide resistance regulator